MNSRSSRRRFLKAAGFAAAAPAFVPNLLSAPPNGKLQHACIGTSGMGWNDFNNLHKHERMKVVAICDVDRTRMDRVAKKRPDARRYQDWRELLAAEGDKIDSVNVSVPDHMHAAIVVTALRAGKHVYCQKPLCHDVAECRVVAAEATKAGVVTQLGTQHASGIGDRMAVQFLRDEVVGKIKHAYLCSNRPGAFDKYRLVGPRPKKGEKPPEGLDWDKWLGTAPIRPYAPKIYHPQLWRAWQDFGTGWSGDIGCHIFDAVWKGLGLTAPKTVHADVQGSWAASPQRRTDNWPRSDHITWVFPGTDKTASDELTVEWFDGMFYPPSEIQTMYKGGEVYPGESAMLIGTKGALLLPHSSGPQLLPRDRFRGTKRPKLPGRNHYHHFADACLGGEMTESHFQQVGPMTETILLGTVAFRTPGKVLQWDAANMKIPNSPEAQKFLRRTYRKGWEVEGL